MLQTSVATSVMHGHAPAANAEQQLHLLVAQLRQRVAELEAMLASHAREAHSRVAELTSVAEDWHLHALKAEADKEEWRQRALAAEAQKAAWEKCCLELTRRRPEEDHPAPGNPRSGGEEEPVAPSVKVERVEEEPEPESEDAPAAPGSGPAPAPEAASSAGSVGGVEEEPVKEEPEPEIVSAQDAPARGPAPVSAGPVRGVKQEPKPERGPGVSVRPKEEAEQKDEPPAKSARRSGAPWSRAQMEHNKFDARARLFCLSLDEQKKPSSPVVKTGEKRARAESMTVANLKAELTMAGHSHLFLYNKDLRKKDLVALFVEHV